MFKPQYTPLALIIGSLISPASFADETITDNSNDDIVISASRVETKRVETGSSITVLDEAYLKENQARTVAELLQDVPGVSVTNTGGLGATTSVFIRGAESNKTLVIIDGVEVNDQSNTGGGYDFAYLMTDNIERIEILKGSQSALWGSDAMGGVINITTKQAKAGSQFNAGVEVGEHGYHRENASISGSQNGNFASISMSSLHTDGYTSTDADPDDDGYKNKTAALKLGRQFNNIFAMDLSLRVNDAYAEFDSGYLTSLQRQAKLNTKLNLLNNKSQNRISYSFSDSDRQYPEWSLQYIGTKEKIDFQSDYYFDVINSYTQRISFITEHEKNTFENTTDEYQIDTSGAILEYNVDWAKKIFVTAAIRHDNNETFDDTTTYHIDLSSWLNEGTRIHSSYGTGSKNPGLFQLYGYIGNTDLTAEKSRSWDAGIEYNFSDVDAYIDVTYFNSHYTDMIVSDYDESTYISSQYYNLDNETSSQGLEFTGSLRMTKDFRLNTAYTYMDTDNGSGDELARRPKHSASINANYKYTPKLSANIGFNYVGDRLNNNSSTTELDSYMLTNIAVAYQVHKHIGLSARLENAFNENYEEASGYNTDDRTIYVGINFK